MSSADVVVETPVRRSARVMQLEGMFGLSAERVSRSAWTVEAPLGERDWAVGLIVGPSGSGKTMIARHLFGDFDKRVEWSGERSVIDEFPSGLPVGQIVELLSSVGFSSPPSWLRPFCALSNGEQFRVGIARLLAERPELAVVDEFTSVVDRTVAHAASHAIAKTVRRNGSRLVAVTCHEDVEAWLQPDWTYRPATNEFAWGCLQPRPSVEVNVCRVPTATWALFRHHHYLDTSLHRAAICFGAFLEGRLAAFSAWLQATGVRGMKREHRTVTLPDYQGFGVGNRLSSVVASSWRGLGFRAVSTTGHPGMVAVRNRSDGWRMTRRPSLASGRSSGGARHLDASRATRRYTASFEYIGEPMLRADAHSLHNCWVGVDLE